MTLWSSHDYSVKAGFFFFKLVFIYLIQCSIVLGLCCCAQAFSSCGELGLLSSCGAQAAHCSDFSRGAWALGMPASVGTGLSCPASEIEPMSSALAGGFFT